MSMNSLIADALARIRNALMVKHEFVILRHSKMVASIIKVLQEEGYITDYEVLEQKPGIHLIKVDLKYYRNEPVIRELRMLSKPGCRVYKSVKKFPKAANGLGTVIISTSRGVMADHQALEMHIGGELICEVN